MRLQEAIILKITAMEYQLLFIGLTEVMRLLGCALTLLIVGGCAPDVRSTYRFRALDGSTGIPLSGVLVDVYGNGHYHYNRLFPGNEHHHVLPTGDLGTVAIDDVITSGGWQYFIDFTKPGYRALTLAGGPERRDASWFFSYKNAQSVPADDAWTSQRRLSRDSINDIPMYRLSP